MDLGIAGRHAIVCAASRGLGRACAVALASEGVNLTINGRDAEALESVRSECEKHGVSVQVVRGDLNDLSTHEALITACPQPDILINNNGGPAPSTLKDWDRQAWEEALHANLVVPMLLIRSVSGGMQERNFGRIINITSAMVKTPATYLGRSAAARAGLTAVCKALSREFAASNVTINNLLPGRVATDRLESLFAGSAAAAGVSLDEFRQRVVRQEASGRLGTPEEFAAACVFLCSTHAAYVNGENILLDGGSSAGVF